MTEKQSAPREGTSPFDLSSMMAMMEEMMGSQGCGCGCGEMMQVASKSESRDCADMMSQMMAMFSGEQTETE